MTGPAGAEQEQRVKAVHSVKTAAGPPRGSIPTTERVCPRRVHCIDRRCCGYLARYLASCVFLKCCVVVLCFVVSERVVGTGFHCWVVCTSSRSCCGPRTADRSWSSGRRSRERAGSSCSRRWCGFPSIPGRTTREAAGVLPEPGRGLRAPQPQRRRRGDVERAPAHAAAQPQLRGAGRRAPARRNRRRVQQLEQGRRAAVAAHQGTTFRWLKDVVPYSPADRYDGREFSYPSIDCREPGGAMDRTGTGSSACPGRGLGCSSTTSSSRRRGSTLDLGRPSGSTSPRRGPPWNVVLLLWS